mmetsp:Transcript_33015/g.83641  ORF Transcript_33015/g.83641 Transcript_33015/m.83641 type:complete len:262 (+) Transcript_33015:254-1039(+)
MHSISSLIPSPCSADAAAPPPPPPPLGTKTGASALNPFVGLVPAAPAAAAPAAAFFAPAAAAKAAAAEADQSSGMPWGMGGKRPGIAPAIIAESAAAEAADPTEALATEAAATLAACFSKLVSRFVRSSSAFCLAWLERSMRSNFSTWASTCAALGFVRASILLLASSRRFLWSRMRSELWLCAKMVRRKSSFNSLTWPPHFCSRAAILSPRNWPSTKRPATPSSPAAAAEAPSGGAEDDDEAAAQRATRSARSPTAPSSC